MRIEPELGGCGIVLLGHFNPLIFSPSWFAKNGIISDEEASAAQVAIIHPDIASFRIGKLSIQVEEGRVSAETTEAPWIALSDFLVKTFGEFLIHTPINQMGINRSVHFSVGDEKTRNRIGRLIAPLEPWKEWGEELAKTDGISRGGCVNVVMSQPKVADGKIIGHIQVQVQPSNRLKANTGIFVNVNDHFGPLNDVIGCEQVISILSDNFERSIREAEEKIDIVMSMKDAI